MRKMESLPALWSWMVAGLLLLTPALFSQDESGKQDSKQDKKQIKAKLDRGIRGDQDHEVFVRMADQLFVTAVDYPTFCRENANKKRGALRKQVIAELRNKANASWKLLESTVKALQKDDSISDIKRYFVVNGFGCVASTEACKQLAAHQAVGFIYKKPLRNLPPVSSRALGGGRRIVRRGGGGSKRPVSVPWNLKEIQANQVWKQEQVTGKGIIIALLDSGIHMTPPLITALWRNAKEKLNGKDDDGNGYVDDIFGWDFQGRSNSVVGDFGIGHGSMCGGIMAGRPVDTGKKKMLVTGIAPEARLMMLRGMGYIAAYEYALANGASVISMSYMWVNRPLGNWRGLYRLAHEHMTAAGIVSVGGAGNYSRLPHGKQIALPKDIPCVVAAAGLDKTMVKARASSEGPCYWDDVVFYRDHDEDDPLQKPDVTGFFTDYPVWFNLNLRGRMMGRIVRSVTYKGDDGYGLVVGPGGNSFSGPHAGGVAALMLSANMDAPAWRVIEVMKKTCKDWGEKGHDTVYGAGLLQALKAVQAIKKKE
ncbi:MAG: S8 family serine peptidase [Planctomycetota bacterium]|jgi:hypothetical protein